MTVSGRLAAAGLLFAAAPAALAQAPQQGFAVTLPGARLQTGAPGGGAPRGPDQSYQQWGSGFGTVTVDLPFSGVFRITLEAGIVDGATPALTELRIDQTPLGFEAGYTQTIAVQPASYVWVAYLTAGQHDVSVSLMNRTGPGQGSLLVHSLRIDSPGPTPPPPEPAGARDPWLQPFSSFSLWNTALGSGARWSQAGDADTIDLRHSGTINAGEWSMPFYHGQGSDPLARFVDGDPLYPLAPQVLHLPASARPAPPEHDGDHHMIVFDADRSHVTHFFGCRAAAGGFACGQSQRDSVCGDGLGGYGWGAGVIRRWELEAGTIRHVLRYALPPAFTRAGATWVSGLAWPAMRSDFNGPFGLYRGHVLYGSTIGIPADIDITTLGLGPDGLVLARALQDYGAIQRDTGGSAGIIFYAEQEADGLPQLDAMRADLPLIVPVLAILRNQAPESIGGGGTRRQPALPGIDRTICPSVSRGE